MLLRKLTAVLLVVTLAALLGCAGSGQITAEVDSPAGTATPGHARMYLPQCRGEFDPGAELAKLTAAVPAPGVDSAVWNRLTTELERQLAERAAGKSAAQRPTGEKNLVDIDLVDDGQGGWRLEWPYVNAGDYNLDGLVGVSDLTPIAVYWEAREGDANWAEACCADGNGDGNVAITDITPIGQNYNAGCNGYNIYGRNGGTGPYTLLDSVARTAATGRPPRYSWPVSITYDEYVVAAFDFAGDDRPITPIISENTVVLDDLGLTITGHDAQTATLSGDAGSLAAGDVIVSGVGDGFLGIVDSIDTTGASPVVTYSPGTLEDLFDYAEIEFSRTMSYADVVSFTPAIDGAELLPGGSVPSAVSGDKAGSATLPLQFKFPDNKFGDGFAIQGVIDLKINVDFDLRVGDDWTTLCDLEYFNFETGAEVKGSAVVKWIQTTSLLDKAWHLGSISFAPIPVMVGPVPVVFTPEVDLYCGIKVSGEIGLECIPSVTISAKAGLTYTEATGWAPYSDYSVTGSWGFDKPNVYGKLEADINLFSPQPTIEVYGLAGPYARLHAPMVRVVAQLQTTPPEFSIAYHLGAQAYVGADIDVFGYKIADYKLDDPLFTILYKIDEKKWPLFDSDLQLRIDWEAESAADFAAADPGWTADRGVVTRPQVVWYPAAGGAGSVSGGHPSKYGSLDAEPYALWTEQVVNNGSGQPESGTVTVYVGRLINPARYVVRLDNEWTWPVRITRIAVSGEFASVFTFPEDNTLYKGSWDPIQLETDTGIFTQNNPAAEPGYFPYL